MLSAVPAPLIFIKGEYYPPGQFISLFITNLFLGFSFSATTTVIVQPS